MHAQSQALTDPALVPSLGTILGVWAHPDDEAYLMGGLSILAHRAGERVVCVTATRGELGTSDPEAWPPDRLAAERTREMRRCLDILGVEEHIWLDKPDGGCSVVPEAEGAHAIAEIIERVQPRTVLTFGPDGMTGHSDHVAVCAWTTHAFERAAPAGATLHYATTTPEWFEAWQPIADRLNIMMDETLLTATQRDRLSIDLRPPDDVLDLKVQALRAQTTQIAPLIQAVGDDLFRDWIADEFYRLAAQA
jgi:LmbE family N-acetylglucosaminyl deacetylase